MKVLKEALHQKGQSTERDGAGEPDAGQGVVPGEQDGKDGRPCRLHTRERTQITGDI